MTDVDHDIDDIDYSYSVLPIGLSRFFCQSRNAAVALDYSSSTSASLSLWHQLSHHSAITFELSLHLRNVTSTSHICFNLQTSSSLHHTMNLTIPSPKPFGTRADSIADDAVNVNEAIAFNTLYSSARMLWLQKVDTDCLPLALFEAASQSVNDLKKLQTAVNARKTASTNCQPNFPTPSPWRDAFQVLGIVSINQNINDANAFEKADRASMRRVDHLHPNGTPLHIVDAACTSIKIVRGWKEAAQAREVSKRIEKRAARYLTGIYNVSCAFGVQSLSLSHTYLDHDVQDPSIQHEDFYVFQILVQSVDSPRSMLTVLLIFPAPHLLLQGLLDLPVRSTSVPERRLHMLNCLRLNPESVPYRAVAPQIQE